MFLKLGRLRIAAGLLPLLGGITAWPVAAQTSVGAKFGSHDPRTCSSRTKPLSAATAREYFICDNEYANGPSASGESIHLLSDVKIELGKPRRFDPNLDTFGFAQTNGIDAAHAVVPIRGSFNQWDCWKLGGFHGTRGQNCSLTPNLHATGLCFANSFGDWHCTMTDLQARGEYLPSHPPPTGP